MRNINRIRPFLDELEKIWRKNPDLRFTQLVMNVLDGPGAYYIEDAEALYALKQAYRIED